MAKSRRSKTASTDSIALVLVLMTGLWVLYSISSSDLEGLYQGSPSASAIVGVPKKMGDTVVIAGISLNEQVGKDISALTSVYLTGLADGYASTLDGSTKYSQTLRIAKSGSNGFTGSMIQYTSDSFGNTGDFMVFEYGDPAFEYELLFDQGLVGKIEGNDIPSFESTSMSFMGSPVTVYKATVYGDSVTLRFFGAGGDFEFRDSDITDDQFERVVKINGRTVNSQVKISGSVDGDRVRIFSMTYRFLAYSKAGGDTYVPPKRGIRQFMREPQALINPSFDMVYAGFAGQSPAASASSSSSTSYRSGGNLFFDPSGGQKYNLIFTNTIGQTYKIPYVTLVGGTVVLGNGKESLVVKEGNAPNDFNIDPGDYFIVSSSNDISGVTSVAVYSSVSREANSLYFDFLGGGGQTVSYDPATGRGELVIRGITHTVYVDLTGTDRVVIDQDHSGSFTGATVPIVLMGGAQLNPGSSSTTVRIPRRLFDNPPSSDETVTIQTFGNGNYIDLRIPDQGSLVMYQSADRLVRGMTNYGVQYTLDDVRAPSTLAVDVPRGQAHPKVVVASGVGRVQKAGQSGAVVVITLERERFLGDSKATDGASSGSGVGIND